MIEGVTEKDIESISKLYQKAETEILDAIANSDPTKTASKRKLLRQIRQQLQDLEQPTLEFMEEKTLAEYKSGIKEVDDALEDVNLEGGFDVVDSRAPAFIISNADAILEDARMELESVLSNSYLNIQKVISQTTQDVQRELLSQIAQGQILGTARQKIRERVVGTLLNRGITGFTALDAKGNARNYSLKATAERLVRQTIMNGRDSAVLSKSIEKGSDLVKVSEHSGESPMCQKYSGQIVSISGTSDEYPSLSSIMFSGDYTRGGGIRHPYCRHTLIPYIPTKIKFN